MKKLDNNPAQWVHFGNRIAVSASVGTADSPFWYDDVDNFRYYNIFAFRPWVSVVKGHKIWGIEIVLLFFHFYFCLVPKAFRKN